MSRSIREYLQHMLDETQYLVSQTRDLDKAVFLGDETLKRAFAWEAPPPSGRSRLPCSTKCSAPVILLVCSWAA